MGANTLPEELKRYIASYCTDGTLASLATVSSSFQASAESMLYRNTTIRMESDKSPILQTLATSPAKAALVQRLVVEFGPLSWTSVSQATGSIGVLFEVLKNACALRDLRLRLPVSLWYDFIRCCIELPQINKALMEGPFELTTLYCNYYLDLNNIVQRHKSLQIVGIYDRMNDHGIWPTPQLLAVLEEAPASPLIFVMAMEEESDIHYDTVTGFPASTTYRWDHIAASMDVDRFHPSTSDITTIKLALGDSADPELFGALLKNMNLCFKRVDTLMMTMAPSSSIAARQLATLTEVLERVSIPGLFRLSFQYADNTDTSAVFNLSQTEKAKQADRWMRVSPILRLVQFADASTWWALSYDDTGWMPLSEENMDDYR